MTPTAKLRWLHLSFSPTFYKDHPSAINSHGWRVLQQWWEPSSWGAEGEWRDIPIAREE